MDSLESLSVDKLTGQLEKKPIFCRAYSIFSLSVSSAGLRSALFPVPVGGPRLRALLGWGD